MTVVTSEGDTYLAEPIVVKGCTPLRSAMQLDGGENNSEPIHLPNVSSRSFEIIEQWFAMREKRKDRQRFRPTTATATEGVDGGVRCVDRENVTTSEMRDILFETMHAADYMGVDDLVDDIAKLIASEIKGMDVHVMRTYFGVETDFSAEEEEQVARDNGWCLDL